MSNIFCPVCFNEDMVEGQYKLKLETDGFVRCEKEKGYKCKKCGEVIFDDYVFDNALEDLFIEER